MSPSELLDEPEPETQLPDCAFRLLLCEQARGLGLAYYQKLPRQEYDGEDYWSVGRDGDGLIVLSVRRNLAAQQNQLSRKHELSRKLGRLASEMRGAKSMLAGYEARPRSEQTMLKPDIEQCKDAIAAFDAQIEAASKELDSLHDSEIHEQTYLFNQDLSRA